MISKLFLLTCLFSAPCAVLAKKNKYKPTPKGRASLAELERKNKSKSKPKGRASLAERARKNKSKSKPKGRASLIIKITTVAVIAAVTTALLGYKVFFSKKSKKVPSESGNQQPYSDPEVQDSSSQQIRVPPVSFDKQEPQQINRDSKVQPSSHEQIVPPVSFDKEEPQQINPDPEVQPSSHEQIRVPPVSPTEVNTNSVVKRDNPILLFDGYFREFRNDEKNPYIPKDIERIIFKFYYHRLMYLRPRLIGKGNIKIPWVLAYNSEKDELFTAGYNGIEVRDTKACKVKTFLKKSIALLTYDREEEMFLYTTTENDDYTKALNVYTLEKANFWPDNIKGFIVGSYRKKNMLFFRNYNPKSITVLDSKTFLEKGTVETNFGSAAYDENKNRLLTAEGETITVWDLNTFKKIRDFKGNVGPIKKLRCDSKGNRLFAAGSYGIEVWNIHMDPYVRIDTLEGDFHKLDYNSEIKVLFAINEGGITAWNLRDLPFSKINTLKEAYIRTIEYKKNILFTASRNGIKKWTNPYEI